MYNGSTKDLSNKTKYKNLSFLTSTGPGPWSKAIMSVLFLSCGGFVVCAYRDGDRRLCDDVRLFSFY